MPTLSSILRKMWDLHSLKLPKYVKQARLRERSETSDRLYQSFFLCHLGQHVKGRNSPPPPNRETYIRRPNSWIRMQDGSELPLRPVTGTIFF